MIRSTPRSFRDGPATTATTLAAILMLVGATQAASAADGPPVTSRPIDGSYKLTFDDEFNGTSIDTSKWVVGFFPDASGNSGPVNAYESQNYSAGQVSVTGGMLVITAAAQPLTVAGTTRPYRSGLVSTIGRFQQAYGYFEARICLAGSNGVISDWPAWWLVGQSDPQDGELDIMEGLKGMAAYHFHSPAGVPGASVVGDYTGCHVYAALWAPGSVKYYYDGIAVGTITEGITGAPQSMLLNLAVGGYGGPSAPAQMSVDYVRAYSNAADLAAVAPQPGYDGLGAQTSQIMAQTAPAAVAPQYARNLVVNPGFESGLSQWRAYGGATASRNGSHSGSGSAAIRGMGGVEQTVGGLSPSQAYLLTGWVRADAGTCAAIGVKDFGAPQIANCSTAGAWSKISIPFMTGRTSTSAKVFYYQASGSSQADDLSLISR